MRHPFLQLSLKEQVAPVYEALDWGQRRPLSHRKRVYGPAKGFDAVVTLGAVNSLKGVPRVQGRKFAPSDVEFLASEVTPKCMVNIMRDKNVFWYNQFLADMKILEIGGLRNVLGDWGQEIHRVMEDLHRQGYRSVYLNFDAQAKPINLVPDICNTLQAILTFDMKPAKLLVNSFVRDRFSDETIDSLEVYEKHVLGLFPEFTLERGFRESSDMASQTLMEYTHFIRKEQVA